MGGSSYQNPHSNPVLGTYCDFKHDFGMEIYLDSIKNYEYSHNTESAGAMMKMGCPKWHLVDIHH